MPRLKSVVQGTDHWHDVRLGKITASRVSALLGIGEYGGREQAGRDIRACVPDHITDNSYMAHGRKYEANAVARMGELTGELIEEGGFFIHPRYNFAAASPDGLIGDDTCVEVKCPYVRPHFAIKPEYWCQMQHQMACTETSMCHFGVRWIAQDEREGYDKVDPRCQSNEKTHTQTWKVYPSLWWQDVIGPELRRRYQHAIVGGLFGNKPTFKMQAAQDAKNLHVEWRRYDEDVMAALIDSSEGGEIVYD